MKQPIIILGKLAFWAMFIWNTGWIQVLNSSSGPELSKEQQAEGKKILDKFVLSKLETVESGIQKGEIFTPAEYFQYVKEKMALQDSLGCYISADHEFDLQNILDKELRSGICSYESLDKARTESGVEHIMPKNVKPLPHIDPLSWLWNLYLHMIPFVIFLFLLWIWEGKESAVLSLKSPLCFLILVCFHPIYITRLVVKWWRENGRSLSAELEIRRRKKNIFAKLSTEERLFIDAFAKNKITFKQFISWVGLLGYRKHSVALALIAMLLSGVIEESKACHRFLSTKSATEVHQITRTSQHGYIIDHDVGVMCWDGEIVSTDYELVVPIKIISRNIFSYHVLLATGYTQTCEPVPIVC